MLAGKSSIKVPHHCGEFEPIPTNAFRDVVCLYIQNVFLEIPDIIGNVGLMILEGFMENQNDKVFTYFLVEGNKDVHRVENLWLLMHLLQPNTKGNCTSNFSSIANPKVIDNVSQTFDIFQLPPTDCRP